MKTFLSRILVLSSVSGLLLLPAVSSLGAATSQTNSPTRVDASPKRVNKTSKRPDDVPGRGDYTSFKVIADRNIFNGNRSRSRVDAPRPVKVESFALAGTLSYEKGTFAFFDGSSAEYRKVLKPEGTIAGYKITEITPDVAKLEAGDQKLEMRVGMQLRREDEGEWKLSARSEAPSSSGSRDSRSRDSGQRDDRSRFSSDRGSSSRDSGGRDHGRYDRGGRHSNEPDASSGYAKESMKDFAKEVKNDAPKDEKKDIKDVLKKMM